jgi:2,3-bisphosphoglycerate-independent phosphoglycerate mutase
VAYRCNLVSIGPDGTMVDFAGGHPSTEEAAEVVAALDEALGTDEVSFDPGVPYRHIVVAPAGWGEADCTPPHDLSDKPVTWPTGPAASELRALMEGSREIVGASGLAANQVWLWGQGTRPKLAPFRDTHGVDAGMVTAVDLVRGLGVLTGMEIVEGPGATGWFDTDYEAKRDAALGGLADGMDLFLIHVEATDEAGHAGDLDEKITALEHWDRRILTDLVDGLGRLGPWRLLLLPDHATPVERKTHTSESVPYLLVDSANQGPGGTYSEPATAACPPVPGHHLMGRLIGAH